MGFMSTCRRAVVIGASIAGLVAARAAQEFFDEVTVLNRDARPATPRARRGVPQSRQAHALLARGSQALEELFPGFIGHLLAAGAATGDAQNDFRWYLDGHLMRQAPSPIPGFGV